MTSDPSIATRPQKILVTGGAGFIGSHLVEHYQGKAEIVVLDNFRTGHRKNLDGLDCTLIEGSITNQEDVDCAMHGVDYVFHLAALVSVPESIEQPEECERINVQGTLNVLNAAAKHGVKKFIHASSAAVYGDNPIDPKTEDMEPAPKSPYASTKLEGERMAEQFRLDGELNTCSLRFFNVFGPRQDPNSAYAAAIPIFIKQALSNEPITIYGDGEQTRDFIYVKDLVAAMGHASTTDYMHGAYNVGYGKSITINQLAEEIIDITNSTSSFKHAPDRLGDIKHSTAFTLKLSKTGFIPTNSLYQGLIGTIHMNES